MMKSPQDNPVTNYFLRRYKLPISIGPETTNAMGWDVQAHGWVDDRNRLVVLMRAILTTDVIQTSHMPIHISRDLLTDPLVQLCHPLMGNINDETQLFYETILRRLEIEELKTFFARRQEGIGKGLLLQLP